MAALVAGLLTASADAVSLAAQAADSPMQLAAQARKLTISGQLDESVALYRKALAADKDLFEAHLGLGIALDLQGAFAEAREHLARAVALASPGMRGTALAATAVSFVFEGRTDEAAGYYKKQFDMQMAAGGLDAAAATANALGRAYLEAGRLDLGAQWYRTGYETAQKLSGLPADQVDLWEMRWLHAQSRLAARRGQAVEAARHAAALKRLVDKGGENANQMPIYHYLIGYNAFHGGELDAAVAALAQADQEDPFILALLAEAHAGKGDAARAREYWTRVLAATGHSLQNALVRETAKAALKR